MDPTGKALGAEKRSLRPGDDCRGVADAPFLLDYDLVILATPLGGIRDGALGGFLDWDKTLLAAFMLSLTSRRLAMAPTVSLAPFVMTALFVAILRRGVLADHPVYAPAASAELALEELWR